MDTNEVVTRLKALNNSDINLVVERYEDLIIDRDISKELFSESMNPTDKDFWGNQFNRREHEIRALVVLLRIFYKKYHL